MFADKHGITCLIFFVATIMSYVKDATRHCLPSIQNKTAAGVVHLLISYVT